MKTVKPKFMRGKTKEELKKLAAIMVREYNIEKIRGTNEFLEFAIHEAEKEGLDINWQTIRLQSQFLEKAITSLNKELSLPSEIVAPEWEVKNEEVWPETSEIKNKFVVMAVLHYNDNTTTELYYTPQMDFKPEYVNPQQRVPEYSMFVEGEDGLIIIKGTNKGKLVEQLDELNWKGYSKSWASYMLKEDKNLTDDDRDIFNKMIVGKI